MDLWIVTPVRPLSGTFVRISSLDATTTGTVAVTFLSSHRALSACLAFFRHDCEVVPYPFVLLLGNRMTD
jgi:hypothetical protein